MPVSALTNMNASIIANMNDIYDAILQDEEFSDIKAQVPLTMEMGAEQHAWNAATATKALGSSIGVYRFAGNFFWMQMKDYVACPGMPILQRSIDDNMNHMYAQGPRSFHIEIEVAATSKKGKEVEETFATTGLLRVTPDEFMLAALQRCKYDIVDMGINHKAWSTLKS